MRDDPDFLKAAFQSQHNLIGLATAVGFAVVGFTWLPLLLAAGVELIVLPLVASSPRFQRLVRTRLVQDEMDRAEAAKEDETGALLAKLPASERARYAELQLVSRDIRENYQRLHECSQPVLAELVAKMDYLLAFWIRTRGALVRYAAYLASTDADEIRARVAELDREIAQAPARVQPVKAKTRAVLVQRLERHGRAEENRQLVEAQTETVVEVLQLLRDQSFAMNDPRTIASQLDSLVASAETAERDVRDIEDVLALEEAPPSARAAAPRAHA